MADEALITERDNFISKLDTGRIDNRITFKDRLITLSETTGKEVGELSICIEGSAYGGQECYLVQASSNGVVDTIPVGTNITAYVTPQLVTLEHTQHEYVNIPGKTLIKRSVLTRVDDEYTFVLTTSEGDKEECSTFNYTLDDMQYFVSEGANLALQRLSVVMGMQRRMCFKTFDSNNNLTTVTYSPLETRSVSLQDVTLDTVGIERSVDDGDEVPTMWNIYLFSDGHMYTRNQVGSPVYMKIKQLPEQFVKDENADWIFTDFGQGKLNWEDDLEMLSHFLDRKAELSDDHINYMRRHPELKAILGDFLQFLLMRKPSDVIEFAADFFSSYSSTAQMKPAFAHSDHVNKSAIQPESNH